MASLSSSFVVCYSGSSTSGRSAHFLNLSNLSKVLNTLRISMALTSPIPLTPSA